MKKNKFLSLFTAAVLTVTGFWQNAALTASAAPKFFGAEIPEGSALAYSENSFGAMIANSINQENMRIMMNSVVHSVEMNGTEATVNYESKVAGRAVVCVYEDVGADKVPRLLGTGIQNFDAELNTVTVPVQMTALPEYYLVRVYLIGENDVPLSAEYSDPMHTREMQVLLQSDISYYMKDYEVLNMDGRTDTNYAVYSKDVEVLYFSKMENRVLSQDNENCVFEIENYTGPTQTGAIVSVECGNGTAAIFKIDSVEKNGDVTTIQGDRSMKTEDAFIYLKIETDTTNNSVTYTPPEPSEDTEGIVFECVADEKPAQGRPAVAAMTTDAAGAEEESEEEIKNYQETVHFRIQFGKGEEGRDHTTGVDMSGFVDFQFDYHVEIYKAAGWDKISLDLSNIIEVGVEASITAEKKIPFGTSLVMNPVGDVIIILGPYADFSITGMIDVSTEFSWSYGTGQKFHADAVVTDISLTAEGFIGVGLGAEIWGLGKGGGVSVVVGLKADFTTNPPHEGCGFCSDIALYFVGELDASLDIGIVDIGITPGIEIDFRHYHLSDTMGFGRGECPNLNGIPNNPEDPEDPEDPENPTQQEEVLSQLEKQIFKFVYYGEMDGRPVAYLSRHNSMETNKYTEALTEFIVPEYDNLGNKVVGIDAFCFTRLDNLKRVVLHDNILDIKAYAFQDCKALEDVNLPKNLRTMGKSAFDNCGIREIIIPRSLRIIPEKAFYLCEQAKNIVIPEGVKTIEDDAFAGAGDDTPPIKIPMSVESVGKYAMNGAKVMSPIYVRNIGERAFSGCDFYDPETKSNTLVLSPFIRTIAKEAFYGSDAEKVVFPKYCTTVFSPHSFKKLECATEIVLPDNMIRIPDSMFRENRKLEKVCWPSRLIEVGDYAFYACLELQNESFPRTLRKVGAYSFGKCWNLEQSQVFKLPYGLKEIGDNAFISLGSEGPEGLVEFHIPETVEKIYFSSFSSVNTSLLRVYFWNPNTEILGDPDTIKEQYASLIQARTTIFYGYDGSTAQTFAENEDHHYNFVVLRNPENNSGQTNNPQTMTVAPQSMTFKDLQPNTIYNFYDLLGDEFTASNLLYISQGISDSNGTLIVSYLPKSNDADANKFVIPAQVTTTAMEQPVSEIKGDVNGDFSVDVSDVVLGARFLAEDVTAPIKRQGISNLEVNGDGVTTPEDTIMILKFIAKIITSLD